MSYKILINGRNTVLAADIIRHTSDDCICFSTSDLWADINVHIKFMEPDAYIVFHTKDDDKERILNQIHKLLEDGMCKEMAFVIVADSEDLEEFEKMAPLYEMLKIARPTSAREIETRTVGYIEALAKKRMEEEQKLREMEAASRAHREELKAMEEFKRKKKQEEKEKERKSREEPAAVVTAKPSKSAETEESGEKKHILIVDDDRNVLKLLKATLSDKYEVTAMLNGKMAEKYLETKTADLILLDHEMPVESGLEVFQKIKENNSQKNIPVVFLTGTSDAAKIKEILSLHPKGYLLKPVDVDKLMSTIADALS